jgi:hypothetical protein
MGVLCSMPRLSQKQFWTVAGAHHNDLLAMGGPLYCERLHQFYSDRLAASIGTQNSMHESSHSQCLGEGEHRPGERSGHPTG